MTDRNLEEAIFELQRRNTEDGVKRLAEEAARLLAEGRQIEAGAVMEKAEAIMAVRAGKPISATAPRATSLGRNLRSEPRWTSKQWPTWRPNWQMACRRF